MKRRGGQGGKGRGQAGWGLWCGRTDLGEVGARADDADVIWAVFLGSESDVLPDHDADADARRVEAVEEALDVARDDVLVVPLLPLDDALGYIDTTSKTCYRRRQNATEGDVRRRKATKDRCGGLGR